MTSYGRGRKWEVRVFTKLEPSANDRMSIWRNFSEFGERPVCPRISPDRKGKGKIIIEYATVDDYERVVEMLRAR